MKRGLLKKNNNNNVPWLVFILCFVIIISWAFYSEKPLLLLLTLALAPSAYAICMPKKNSHAYGYPRNCIVIGTSSRALNVAAEVVNNRSYLYGFIDNCNPGPQSPSTHLLCGLSDLSSFLRTNPIDEALICLPIISQHKQISDSINTCAEFGIPARVLMDLFESPSGKARTNEQSCFITFNDGILKNPRYMFKRYFDLAAASLLMIFLSPLLLLAAVLIKLDSKGPVLFVQNRIGYNKHIFRMYKFRTMVQDAESMQDRLEHMNEASGPVFKIRKDPRITRMGRFLRSTSIDELPQLLNVVKGDMSLVGPRPLPLRDYTDKWRTWHCRRFSVIPGITCLWQISGRCNLSFDQWMELDLKYIDNWSFYMDIMILLKTIPAILSRRGAC